MATLEGPVEQFFVFTNLTLSDGNALTDAAKNASLLGTEGSHILLAHPFATQAATLSYNAFSQAVGQLFERPTYPVRAEFEFRSRKQGACETVAENLTALALLYISTAIGKPKSNTILLRPAHARKAFNRNHSGLRQVRPDCANRRDCACFFSSYNT